MAPAVMDGDRWIAERLRFLRERLAGDISDAERAAIEDELQVLSRERGITTAGHRRFRLWRRWVHRGVAPDARAGREPSNDPPNEPPREG